MQLLVSPTLLYLHVVHSHPSCIAHTNEESLLLKRETSNIQNLDIFTSYRSGPGMDLQVLHFCNRVKKNVFLLHFTMLHYNPKVVSVLCEEKLALE